MRETTPELDRQALLRSLPSIDELLVHERVAGLIAHVPRTVAVEACRSAVQAARARIMAGETTGFDVRSVAAHLSQLTRPSLRRVINATGVVLHTNLGRAPLSERAIERLAQLGRSYCNLELELDEGERGSRSSHVASLLMRLTGAEASLVVNNCAAATLLTLSALAEGREVIVSRGELVEIGGGFRIPDVMQQSGCKLVEVGTTNRTRIGDFERAISEKTALLVKVHRSNFAMLGFTEDVGTRELVALARRHRISVFEDLGSGALMPLHAESLRGEPTVRTCVSSGADVVSFSGDKLLGGPQAGIVVGSQVCIDRLARHPLNRALRVDKLTIAALEATLEHYRDDEADQLVPTRALLTVSLSTLKQRADGLADRMAQLGVSCRVVEAHSKVGGGALPLANLPSYAVAVSGRRAVTLHDALRAGEPAVVARVADEEVCFDVRCLTEADCEVVASRVAAAVRGAPC